MGCKTGEVGGASFMKAFEHQPNNRIHLVKKEQC